MGKDMIIRVQSGEHGTVRISVKLSETTAKVYQKLQDAFNLPESNWVLCKERNGGSPVKSSSRKTVKESKLQHGDLLFLKPYAVMKMETEPIVNGASNFYSRPSSSSQSTSSAGSPNHSVIEDEVDRLLDKSDGRIQRKRNEQMCHHGPLGKCLHCVPLEPFDESYLKSCDPPIKFLSFHSYIRKLRSGVDKGKFVNLENLSCKIKDCKEHAPWPAGICTKCQPNAVTLNRQAYRHVDYVQFENGNIIDRFLNYWRQSGCQRMGFLLGRYEQHPDMPLAIRAVVSAIYEPPQRSTNKMIQILDIDPDEQLVDDLASELGLRRVGWIFTDLSAGSNGTVKHTRGSMDSYFLSAEECITAANFQNKYPNRCRFSSDGVFGSKFVTVVVTGDKDNQIHFEGYQVSDQCMGLVRDNCLIPTVDAPELGYIRESTNEQYVPDVFYKNKDEYGNEVTRLARPLPVEYLVTDMSVAFPKEQTYTFSALSLNNEPFPACNRAELGILQNMTSLGQYMRQFNEDQFLQAISDFNVLFFLYHNDVLPMKEHMSPLLNAVCSQDTVAALQWSHSEQWSTMTHLLQHSGTSDVGTASHSSGPQWQCLHCTFINTNPANCEMCTLPKSN